ncbi:GGDEF domain-containing protein [uncultured Pseudokineococcus sp.]|uniref:GGDEF domain-containing protein n=1 Tax=uncultured Pseudokineococcus sp. TaxID=1642928 RepID=UPI0026339CE5|nr:GGDEF domain-containing protein [uncultured Pseudokineococcus sp.]
MRRRASTQGVGGEARWPHRADVALAASVPVGLVGFVVGGLLSPGGAADLLLTALTVVWLSLPLARLGLRLAAPGGRAATASLLVGWLLWSAGAAWSAVAQQGSGSAALVSPSPVEGLFAASFLGVTPFLLLDVAAPPARGPLSAPRAPWWAALAADVVVLVGGATSAAVGLLAVPLHLGHLDAEQALALGYPAVWLALAALVGLQVLRRQRRPDAGAALLATGCLTLAGADGLLAADVPLPDLAGALHRWTYGVGLVTLTAGAVAGSPGTRSVAAPRSSLPLLVAAAAAVAVLGLRGLLPGPAGAALVAVAVTTLGAVLVRLHLALAQARSATEARRLALTDDLTGLANRRALLEALEEPAEGTHHLLLLDLDGFKAVNDAWGHAAGDAVLREVGRRLHVAAGPDLLVVRLGGDEFAVLAPPGRLPGGADELAASVASAVAAPVVLDDGRAVRVGASVGAATAGGVDDLADVLLRGADSAMYDRKRGRGPTRTLTWSPPGGLADGGPAMPPPGPEPERAGAPAGS